ncbi:MAG: hypothetical protein GXO43_05005 [Crenarchaeota archaeon]|nr:hypothetical protein [Thermoproteota archaeon]
MGQCKDQEILISFIEKLITRYKTKDLPVDNLGKPRIKGVKHRLLYIKVPEEIPVYSILRVEKCSEEDPIRRINEIIKAMETGVGEWLKLLREITGRIGGVVSWPARSKCLNEKHCIIKFLERTRRIGGLIYIDYFKDYELLVLRVLPPYMPFALKLAAMFFPAGYVPLTMLINRVIYEAIIPMARLAPPGHPLDIDPEKITDYAKKLGSLILQRYNEVLRTSSLDIVEPELELLKHIDYPMEELVLYLTGKGIFFAKPRNEEWVIEHRIIAPPVSPEMLIDYMSLREAVETTYPPDVEVDLSL